MRFRAFLVDDEPLARARLRALLEPEADFEIVGEAGDGPEAVERVRVARPDVLFLDVQMPGLDGFGVLEQLEAGERPWVVFVTAHDVHAVRAFQVHALHYVLKPVTPEALGAALERLREAEQTGRTLELARNLERLLESRQPGEAEAPENPARPSRWLVRSSGSVQVVPIDTVLRLEADGDYVRLHAGKQVHLHRATLQALAADLDPSRFARLHRSHVVRLDQVASVRSDAGGDGVVVLADGTELPLSRTYRDDLLRALEGRGERPL